MRRMPRARRVDYPGAIHHVGTRGNLGTAIVFDDDDRHHLLRLVSRACEHYDLECGAYCLMTTHYHLILRSRAGRISRGMAMLNGWFARWINAKYERRGHIFGARFFNRVMEDGGYRREVARYLPLNPVRAGLVHQPERWPWSSYAAMVGVRRPPAFLSGFVVDEWFDGNANGYRAWVQAGGTTKDACLGALFEGYDRPTAVRFAMQSHDIGLPCIARFLGVSERTVWRWLQTATMAG